MKNDDDSQFDVQSNIYGLDSPKKSVKQQNDEEMEDFMLNDFLDDENIKIESDPEEEMLDMAKDLDKRSLKL